MTEEQLTEKEIAENKEAWRQAMIKAHCENQDCYGCPKEEECNEEDAKREAEDEDLAYSQYDGEEFDY